MSLKVTFFNGATVEYKKVDDIRMDKGWITTSGYWKQSVEGDPLLIEHDTTVFDKFFREDVREIIWKNDEGENK